MLDKFAIAKVLREISALLELKEANPYKIKAYKQGAKSLELTADDVYQLYRENNLQKINGIGSALAELISELYSTGKSQLLEQLRSEFSDVAVELAGIEGLTLKRIKKLQESLNIQTREELVRACQNNLLSGVPGLGKTLEIKLLKILAEDNGQSPIILAKAWDLSNRFISYMKDHVMKIEVAGQVRRWEEIVSQIDFVILSNDIEKTKKHFEKFSLFIKSEWSNSNYGTGYLANKPNISIVITEELIAFVCTLHEKTGSITHLNKLKLLADANNDSLYAFVIKEKNKSLTEKDIYENLGINYIPPELRENWGEVEDAQSGEDFADLVTEADIKGMVHCHTNYSDGNSSIEKMALSVQELGYSYITITDHSPTAFYANGIDIERLKRQWEEIDRAQEKVKIKILRGTESDILASGLLDYPDYILEKFDVIIGSIHSRYKMNEEQMTERIKTCISLPVFKIWGHALGRLLLRRDPVPCKLEEILNLAAASPMAIEINGDPHRMDMEPFWLKQASKLGIKFVISTDAHSPKDLLNLPFGVHMARKAGLKRSHILNTLSYKEFSKVVRPKFN